MVGQPLQDSVGKDEVLGDRSDPGLNIGIFELQGWQALMRLLKHLGRVVHANNTCGWVSLKHELRRIPGAATEVARMIDHGSRDSCN